MKFVGLVILLFLRLPASLLAQEQFQAESINMPSIHSQKESGLAEGIEFKRLTIEQGLSHNSVTCILQDRQGFVWFGTYDGLNKYDGYEFTIYKHNPLDSTSISNSYVTDMFEDRSGTLWIATRRGLNRFDREHNRFIRYLHDPNKSGSISNNTVNSIYQDRSGRLWFGTAAGLNWFDPQQNIFFRYLNEPGDLSSLSHNAIGVINEDRSNSLLIVAGGGLTRLLPRHDDREGTKLIRYEHNPENPHSISSNDIRSICLDRRGNLWFGTFGGGLNKLTPGQAQFIHYLHNPFVPDGIPENDIEVVYEDPVSPGTLWIGTRLGGLYKFLPEKGQFIHYANVPRNVSAIYRDRFGILWVGTYDGGISQLYRNREQFTHYSHDPDDRNSLSDNYVRSLYVDRSGTVWIGTHDGGLNKFDPERKVFTRYVHNPEDSFSISVNELRGIYEDSRGTLWIGTYHGGLNSFDRTRDQFSYFLYDPDNPGSISDNRVQTIYEDRAGTLWVGTDNGLNILDRDKKLFTRHFNNPADPKSISHNTILIIHEDRNGDLWFGTLEGLNKLDREQYEATGKLRFTRYLHEPENPASLSQNYVRTIYEDQRGTLWIGTFSGGLNKLVRQENGTSATFVHYTQKDGLPSDGIYGILEDDHGRLWLSTNKGLSRFDPQAETFKNYDVDDGLQGELFVPRASCKLPSGEMLFGGSNGFNLFHPDSIKDNPNIPPIILTDFQIFNESVINFGENSPLSKHISEAEHVVLSYKQNVFSFEFVALNYVSSQKNQYAYKMEGFDEDWNYVGTRRFATYTNLDPGEYVFRVKGSNNDGVWNEEGASIKITILPPWWRTWWAYTLYVVMVLGLLYGIRRYELNRLCLKNQLKIGQIEAEKLKDLDAMKSRFFANISHEFRTPLTLILGPIDNLLEAVKGSQAKKNLRMMRRHAKHLLQLINQLLDLSKLESGKLRLQATGKDVIPVLRGITSAFQSMAEKRKIELQFHSEVDALDLYFDQEKFEKVFYNLLYNAVKFTPGGGKISVQLAVSSEPLPANNRPLTDHCLLITVKDTGIGIPREKLPYIFDHFYQVTEGHAGSISGSTRDFEGTGIGLSLAKDLVELHHGTIEIVSEEGWGTEAIVRLPLGRAHLQDDEIVDPAEAILSEKAPLMPVEFVEAEEASQQSDTLVEVLEQSEEAEIVLVVEDNLDMRRYIRQYLEDSYQVIEARDGREGLEQALTLIPDLVISDIMMPKMDGYALCRTLKTDEKTCHIPVILLTARAAAEDKLAGLEIGADDYLTKPFDAKEVLVRVKNLIQLRQQLRERFSSASLLDVGPALENKLDQAFLKRVQKIVEENMEDETFGVEELAQKLKLSRTQLHRKISALTSRPASIFIRFLRLHHARKMLAQNELTVNEVAYRVGFSSHAYFSKCFRDEFGCTPKEYNQQYSKKSS